MACKGCKNGKGTRHASTGGDLTKFAFLSPRQLRLLKAKEAAKATEPVPKTGIDE
jgi:hypothetical protein